MKNSVYSTSSPNYVPRTRHREPDGSPTFTNRLAIETSPYLLQHAHNPVNWFSWGKEAFDTARQLGRPVLLSVGYSTCHWCHVMEEESFEDLEIAAFINAHFVPVKVDREERPDVDSVYMSAVQIMTGQGGWPMTVVMTPDGEPFFGGTYFPPRDGARGLGSTGFLTILNKLHEAYTTSPETVRTAAQRMSAMLKKGPGRAHGNEMPGTESLVHAAHALAEHFDPEFGGFGRAPKFPRPSTYELLLRYWRRTQDPQALTIVKRSLEKMAEGGLYDQIAGGFHRYSTDREWLVPHFEKMLYDNAQLVSLYLDGYQATHDATLKAIAKDTLEYVTREMTSSEGAFYSATDADSEGEEGLFFVWKPEQLEAALGPDRARVATAYWGVTARGNFEGQNILHRPRPTDAVARDVGLGVEELEAKIRGIKNDLRLVREQRVHPLRDDKILSEWNAQMISAFARAAWVLDEPEYAKRAVKAAEFILGSLTREGRLLRSYRAGLAKHAGVLEDYAFFVAALLDLFESTSDPRWLREAISVHGVLSRDFSDDEKGAFFGTARDAEVLLIREKPSYDGAQPSGNSVAAMNLLRLAEITTEEHYRKKAEAALVALGASLKGGAMEAPKLAGALDWYTDRPRQIAIVARAPEDAKLLEDVLRETYIPNRIVLSVVEGPPLDAIARLVPWLEGKRAIEGRATAYVCLGQVCSKPTQEPEEFRTQLAQVDRIAAPLPLPRPHARGESRQR